MANRIKKLVIGLAAIAAVAAVIVWQATAKEDKSASVAVPDSSRMNTPVESKGRAPATTTVPNSRSISPTKSRSFAERLRQSNDYLNFARSTLNDAKTGDPDAQYYLGKALGFCEKAYPYFFHVNGRPLTLNEGLAYSADVKRSASLTRSIYAKCHDLESVNEKESEFGRASDWINVASAAGQPGAQSTVAITDLQKAREPASPSNPPTAHSDADPRSLLLAAVQSKDPEALWIAGTAQGLINQSFDDKVKNQFAWWLVSCNRGYDCGPGAEWVQMNCQGGNCPPDMSGADYIRLSSGDKWQDVQDRAKAISDKLDAGDWNDLGLQS